MPNYEFTLHTVDELGDVSVLKTGIVEAEDKKAAQSQVIDDYWDPRLEAASVKPLITLNPANTMSPYESVDGVPEFAVGDTITFKPHEHEKEFKARITGIRIRHTPHGGVFNPADQEVMYDITRVEPPKSSVNTVIGRVLSLVRPTAGLRPQTTTGRSILESRLFKPNSGQGLQPDNPAPSGVAKIGF